MVDLRRRRRVDHLHVVFGALLQEAFQPRAGVLRTLAFEAVRQQQHQTAETFPFVFGARDELVDDHLRGIDEVAELRLPKHQPVGPVEAVAVLESEHARLRQRRVVNIEDALPRPQVPQGHIGVAEFGIP